MSEVRSGIDETSFVPNSVFDILSEIFSLIILKINILILDFNLITLNFLLDYINVWYQYKLYKLYKKYIMDFNTYVIYICYFNNCINFKWYKNINNIANQLGYGSTKYVGSGNFGLVYDVGDGKLLKITTDRSEAINANKLRQKPMTKHIMRRPS
jgi:hypothetical protein